MFGKEIISANCEVIEQSAASDLSMSGARFSVREQNSETTGAEFLEIFVWARKNAKIVSPSFKVRVPPTARLKPRKEDCD